MENRDNALNFFKQQYNCSQSVFAAYAGKYGINENDALKVAAAFGGGIGRTQDICGALTGAVMTIGCKYFDSKDPAGSKVLVYNKTKELLAKFKDKNNSIDCLNLTGVDLSTEKGQELFKTLNVHENKCNGYIEDVCRILDEMI